MTISNLLNMTTLRNFVFSEDIQQQGQIDVCDKRLADIFLLKDRAEQELKSALFFGVSYKELLNVYSSWRKCYWLLDDSTYITQIGHNIEELHSTSDLEYRNYILELQCTCNLSQYKLDEKYLKLDEKYLEGVSFADINLTAPFARPFIPTANIILRSTDLSRKVFMQIGDKFESVFLMRK